MNPLAFQTVCSGMAVAVVRHDPKDLLDSGLLHGAKCFDGQDLRTVVKAAVDTMSYPLSPSGAGIPGDTEEDFWGFCKKRSQKKPFFIRHSLSITEQTPGAFGYKFYTLEAPLSGDKALLAYHPETGKYYPVTVADGRVSIAFDSQKNTFADILEMLAPSSTHVGIKLDDKELMTAFIESIAVESKPVKAQF